MILVDEDTRTAVFDFVASAGLRLRGEEITEQPYLVHVWGWTVDDGAEFSYVEDGLPGLSYVLVTANTVEACAEYTAVVEERLQPLTFDQIIEVVASSPTQQDMIESMDMLGVGAPRQFEQLYWDWVTTALRHDNDDLCRHAILAASYMNWPELVDVLAEIESSEHDEEVRRYASSVRDTIARTADGEREP
jgi:hypothetical protein